MLNVIKKKFINSDSLKGFSLKVLNTVTIGIFKNHQLYNFIVYKLKFGMRLTIFNPITLSQKIYYLRNRYKDIELASIVADKIKVRDYVAAKIGTSSLSKLFFTTDNPRKINYEKLPSRFVIKANHGSGMNIFVRDKSQLNQDETNKQLNSWLAVNYADLFGEMQYYKITPKILIEEYLEEEGFQFLIDYKIWCFNGHVKFLYIKENFKLENGDIKYYRSSFDSDFKKINIVNAFNSDEVTIPNEVNYKEIERPKSFDLMIDYASRLSRGFPFVRVDFYIINEKIVFGEMTLTPHGGNINYISEDVQKELGELIDLNLIDFM